MNLSISIIVEILEKVLKNAAEDFQLVTHLRHPTVSPQRKC